MVAFCRFRFVRPGLVALLAMALLVGCSDDTTAPEEETSPPQTTLTIALSAPAAQPGEELELMGVPEARDLSDVYAVVTEPGGRGLTSYALVSRRSDGTPYVVTPLRPSTPVAGGDVEIALAGGGVSSNRVPLEVGALPPATVTVQDLVGTLQDLLTAWLDNHGTTREALRAMNPADIPASLIPLWQAQEIVDSPDNPNSLRALVDGPIPFFDFETFDFDATNRMLSQTDVVPFLGAEGARVDSLTTATERLLAGRAPDAPERLRGCNISAPQYEIQTDVALDAAMRRARWAASRLEGFTGEVLNDFSNTASLAGVLPPLKAGAKVVSGGLYVFKILAEAAAKLLPTSFDYDATTVALADDQHVYNEDDTGGFWLDFKVTGVSRGWELDEDTFKAILKLAKFSDLGGFGDVGPGFDEFGQNLTSYLITQGTKFVIGEVTGGDDFLHVCPGRWPDIDVSSSVFSRSEIAFGTSFEMSSHTFFETREAGVSELKVQTRDDRFGGTPPTSKNETIEVVRIEVVVEPADVFMEASEIQTFEATVSNATDTRVAWTVPAPLQEITRDENTIVVQAPPPETVWTTPVSLRARSQANTGAREGQVDVDPRDGFALIKPRVGSIIVTPDNICVPLGETQPFAALVAGLENTGVTWSASAGFFTDSLYHAPGGPVAEVVITATSVEDEDIQGTATIRVDDCECEWNLLVTGNETGTYGGTFVTWNPGALGSVQMSEAADDPYPQASIQVFEPFTGPGQYDAFAQVTLASGADPYIPLGEEITFTVWSIEGTRLRGSLNGTLGKVVPNPPDAETFFIDVVLTFTGQDMNQVDPCPK